MPIIVDGNCVVKVAIIILKGGYHGFKTEQEMIAAWNTRVSKHDNPKPLTFEQLKQRIGKPVWCSRNKLYGVIGKKDDRLVIGFYYGWEWFEDLLNKPIYDHQPKESEGQE